MCLATNASASAPTWLEVCTTTPGAWSQHVGWALRERPNQRRQKGQKEKRDLSAYQEECEEERQALDKFHPREPPEHHGLPLADAKRQVLSAVHGKHCFELFGKEQRRQLVREDEAGRVHQLHAFSHIQL